MAKIKNFLFFRAFNYAKPYKWEIIKGFIFTLLLLLLSLIPPFFIKILIDSVLIGGRIRILNLLLLGMIGIFLLGLLLDFFQNYVLVRLGQNLNFDIRVDFFKHQQRLSLKFYDNIRIGELIYRLFNDTDTIHNAISAMLINIVVNIGLLLVISVMLVYMNWKLSLFCFLIIPLHIFTILGFRNLVIKYSNLCREKDENISGNIQEVFAGIREIKASATEPLELRRFITDSRQRMKLGLKGNIVSRYSEMTISSITNFWSFALLWFGGNEVIRGNLTIGGLMAFLALAGRLYSPVAALTNITLSSQDVLVGLKRFYQIRDLAPEIIEDNCTPELPLIKGAIEFNNVCFGYSSSTLAVKNLYFKIIPGTVAALVGRSGVGKTTIANLLCRFYQPTSGQILIDGYDISKVRLESLRKQLGIVLQDSYLFSGTVEENIAYGQSFEEKIKDDDIIKSAQSAGAHDFIMSLPQGYQTVIGERGIKLSGGQRQRILIARAFLRNPRILILDEATSALDLDSEEIIQEAVRRLMENRTVLVIAHRLSTIRQADKIIVLDNGEAAEAGNHETLLARQGVYYKLYERIARI